MNALIFRSCLGLCVLGGIQYAQAEGVEFNGFVSAGGGTISDDRVRYLGFEEDLTFEPDSVIALQASSQFNDEWSATAQFVARGEDDFEIEAEWAFAAYEYSDETTFKFGRLRAPLFMLSDYVEVGYAYHWIRPPDEVYGLGLDTVNGVDVNYVLYGDEWEYRVQAYLGSFKNDDTEVSGQEGVDASLSNFTGISFSATKDWFTGRVTVNRADTTLESDLFDTDPSLSVLPDADKDVLRVDDLSGQFVGLGFIADLEDFFVYGEWTSIIADESIFSEYDAWYLSAGKRIEEFTFHVTYAFYENDPELPDPPSGALTAAAFELIEASLKEERSSITGGVRWDFAPAVALKFELQHIDIDTVGGADGDDAIVTSVALDAVF